ncbi:MAG: energy transducer TonB, partial [Bacteroidota bacterium]
MKSFIAKVNSFLKLVLILSILSTGAGLNLYATCAITPEINFNLDADSVGRDSREIFFFVEESPSYPGGNEKLESYFMENLEYPKAAKEKELEGQVYVRFEVKKDGSIGEVIISKSVHPALDSEAIRVIKEMPSWIPGKHEGKPVNSWYTLPISFFLRE